MSAEPVELVSKLSSQQRAAIIEMARSVDLVWDDDPVTVPASHNANMMQIESTLLSFGDAVSMVHQLPLSGVGIDLVDRKLSTPRGTGAQPDTATDGGFIGSDAAAVLAELRAVEADRDPDGRLEGAYGHLTRSQLLAVVEEGLDMVVRRRDPLVVNQGLPILDNLYMAGAHRQGFRDWSELVVADRHRDLALACADIISHCGPAGLAVFLDGYGIDRVDPVRLDWYSHVVALSKG